MVDLKITGKKVLKQAIIVIIAGLIAVYGNNPWFLAVAPVLTGLENIISHWSS